MSFNTETIYINIEEYFKMSDGNELIGIMKDCPTRERLCCLVWCCVMLCLAIATVQMNHRKSLRLLCDSLNDFPYLMLLKCVKTALEILITSNEH